MMFHMEGGDDADMDMGDEEGGDDEELEDLVVGSSEDAPDDLGSRIRKDDGPQDRRRR